MTISTMRPTFDPNHMSWLNYYQSQASQSGHGLQMFHGVPYQRGGGLGSLFKGLFRVILPLAKTAGKSIGKEVLSTGLNIAGDALGGKNIKMAAKRRVRKGARRLVTKAKVGLKKQTGGRRKRKRKGTKRKRKVTRKRKRRKATGGTKRKRRKRSNKGQFTKDIFG